MSVRITFLGGLAATRERAHLKLSTAEFLDGDGAPEIVVRLAAG